MRNWGVEASAAIVVLLVVLALLSQSRTQANEGKNDNGLPGIMDQKMKDFLDSRADDPTQKKLDNMLALVDKILVETTEGKKLFTTSDPQQISRFRNALKIKEDPKTFGHCMCYGDPQIYLYSGNRQIAHLSCQHGFAIRWNDGWKWDAVLKDGMLLTDWLADNGAPQLKKEVEEDRGREERSQRDLVKWVNAMPACLKPFEKEILGTGPGWITFVPSGKIKEQKASQTALPYSKYWNSLKSAYSSFDSAVLALLNWYGSGAGPWSGYPSYESVPEEILAELGTKTIVQAIQHGNLSDTQTEGAARFFGGYKFQSERKQEMKLVPLAIQKKLLSHGLKSSDQDKIQRARAAFTSK